MSALIVDPGDQVLIRGRVKQNIPGVGVLVELFSKTDQYEAWVRHDLIEQVIPAEQTRTFKGFTVAETREAIGRFTELIAEWDAAAEDSPSAALAVQSLHSARDELIAQLEEIGVQPFVDRHVR